MNSFKQQIINAGEIKSGETLKIVFEPLEGANIIAFQPFCGCTSCEITDKKLIVKYKTSFPKHLKDVDHIVTSKSINVELLINGNIKKEVVSFNAKILK